MTFPGFYSISNAYLFLLLAALVLFYFLKLKRPKFVIPSLVLWRRVINDTRVNSPFQRFRRNILLFLQIILLVLLILAAMQPYWQREAARVRRIPILIDCSASMGALDKQGGISRLDEAKKKARDLIEEMMPDQEICLVSFSRTARRMTGFTNDKRLLREALEQIQIEDVPSDIEDALRMTQGLARNAAFDEVLLLSDGNFPTRVNFELPFELNFQRLPEAGPNWGITSLAAVRSREAEWDVFAMLEGSAKAENIATVEVTRDAEVIGTEHLTLRSGKSQRMAFRVAGDSASSLKVNLIPDDFDSLESDNVAFLDLPSVRALSVYVAPSLPLYSRALRGLEEISLLLESGADASRRTYDIVISDRKEDLALEGRTRFYVGLIPEDVQKILTATPEGTRVVDWSRTSTLLAHVDFSDLVILDQPCCAEGVREIDFENIGYEIIIHGHRGPLLLEKREGDSLSFYLLFHSDRSTLPYRVGFPVLLHNLVQQAMYQAGLAEVRASTTGVLPPLTLLPERTYQVSGPGARREEKTDASGVLSGVPTTQVGNYVVYAGGVEQMRVGASLLSSSETALESTDEIQFNELSVTTSFTPLKPDQPLWRYLAFLAFCFLLIEWWFFHRPMRV